MSSWFATTASLGAMRAIYPMSAFHEALLTNGVQGGFVVGTLASAVMALPDRIDLRKFFSLGAAIACAASLATLLIEPASLLMPLFRFATGMAMAAVYPVGIKLAATWARGDLGWLVGLLVGALTLGSAIPHLVAVLGSWDWRLPMAAAGAGAGLAAVLIRFSAVGPNLQALTTFRLGNALEAWRNRPVRLANLGYLGHMWELYAMWAWLGTFLNASFHARYGNAPPLAPELATFFSIAIGAVGALVGGWAADRYGRATIMMVALVISGSCAAGIGLLFGGPAWAVLLMSLVWGISIVADSGQFSASVAELSAPGLVGTMLTAQTCAGFLLTMASIQLVPITVERVGWRYGFAILAIGPALGFLATARLRRRLG